MEHTETAWHHTREQIHQERERVLHVAAILAMFEASRGLAPSSYVRECLRPVAAPREAGVCLVDDGTLMEGSEV